MKKNGYGNFLTALQPSENTWVRNRVDKYFQGLCSSRLEKLRTRLNKSVDLLIFTAWNQNWNYVRVSDSWPIFPCTKIPIVYNFVCGNPHFVSLLYTVRKSFSYLKSASSL